MDYRANLRNAAERFARMSHAELLAEWEERLFESERFHLWNELQASGYRMSSLSDPIGDIPDRFAAQAVLHVQQQAEPMRVLRPMQARVGAGLCYLLAIGALLAGGAPLLSFARAGMFMILGAITQQGSRMAAYAALGLVTLDVSLITLLCIIAAPFNDRSSWIWLGSCLASLVTIALAAVYLARTDAEEDAQALAPEQAT